MYVVSIYNGQDKITIHNSFSNKNDSSKLKTGSIVQGINSIDSFTFSIYPNNVGFNSLFEYKTEIDVYNATKKLYEFQGRILKPKDYMDSSGLVYKEIVCESFSGYLCDSQQIYVEEKNWTLIELLSHIIDVHNSQIEEKKRFKIGTVNVVAPNDNIYIGIQRENTWKTLNDKLIDNLGGELIFRKENDGLYLDYLIESGEHKKTPIKIKKNMKSISKEEDPSSMITRLIPLGAKLKIKDESGNEVESEQRLGIESVNGGKPYIDDQLAIEKYGIIVGYTYYDDVTDPSNLLSKGKEFLKTNNKILNKFSISALDLFTIGLDADDFRVGNYHLIWNPLIGVDETLRIIKKTINIHSPYTSTLDFGDISRSLSNIQLNSKSSLNKMADTISKINNNYTTSTDVVNLVNQSIKKSNVMVKETLLKVNEGIKITTNQSKVVILNDMPEINDYIGNHIQFTISTNDECYQTFDFFLNSNVFYFELISLNSSSELLKTALSLNINNDEWIFTNLNNYCVGSNGSITISSDIPVLKLFKVDIITS